MMCSEQYLDDELDFIHCTLLKNEYPSDPLDSVMRDKIISFRKDKQYLAQKCPIYQRLPFIGSRGELMAKRILSAVQLCYFSAQLRIHFSTRAAVSSMRKDPLHPHHVSSVIYSFNCGCGSNYIGRTSQRLDCRIRQHVPLRVLNPDAHKSQLVNTYGSAITEHLINCRDCAMNFSPDCFFVLSSSHSPFHFRALKSLYIRSREPSLCKQKDCLLGLHVIRL